MSRLNNIVLSYLIVDAFNKQNSQPISLYKLQQYIMTKTGVTETTAKKYVVDLIRGITIQRKLYRIRAEADKYTCEVTK
jgi:hypothetical protein